MPRRTRPGRRRRDPTRREWNRVSCGAMRRRGTDAGRRESRLPPPHAGRVDSRRDSAPRRRRRNSGRAGRLAERLDGRLVLLESGRGFAEEEVPSGGIGRCSEDEARLLQGFLEFLQFNQGVSQVETSLGIVGAKANRRVPVVDRLVAAAGLVQCVGEVVAGLRELGGELDRASKGVFAAPGASARARPGLGSGESPDHTKRDRLLESLEGLFRPSRVQRDESEQMPRIGRAGGIVHEIASDRLRLGESCRAKMSEGEGHGVEHRFSLEAECRLYSRR